MSEHSIRLAAPSVRPAEEVPAAADEPFRAFELLGHYRLAVARAQEELAALRERHRELREQVEAARGTVAVLEKDLADNLTGWAALEEVEGWRRDLLHRWDSMKVQLQLQHQEQLLLQWQQGEEWRQRLVALQNSWSTRIGRIATWPARAACRALSHLRRSA